MFFDDNSAIDGFGKTVFSLGCECKEVRPEAEDEVVGIELVRAYDDRQIGAFRGVKQSGTCQTRAISWDGWRTLRTWPRTRTCRCL